MSATDCPPATKAIALAGPTWEALVRSGRGDLTTPTGRLTEADVESLSVAFHRNGVVQVVMLWAKPSGKWKWLCGWTDNYSTPAGMRACAAALRADTDFR